jgi:lipoprotein-anchoring transpeptidase ErfK/SrfK
MKRTIFVPIAISAAVFAPAVQAVDRVPASFPAAGYLTVEAVTVRAEPSYDGRRVTMLHDFRRDYRPQVVLGTASSRDAEGRLWLRVRLQLRPNGTTGWIPAPSAALRPMRDLIVVHRGARTIDLLRDGRALVHAPVAIGAPGSETPLGEFYVTARFVPNDRFLGVFAFETSAYSKLSDWPGGGVVGLHGWADTSVLGRAVSHGCIRVSNDTAAFLRDRIPVGTPIRVVAT